MTKLNFSSETLNNSLLLTSNLSEQIQQNNTEAILTFIKYMDQYLQLMSSCEEEWEVDHWRMMYQRADMAYEEYKRESNGIIQQINEIILEFNGKISYLKAFILLYESFTIDEYSSSLLSNICGGSYSAIRKTGIHSHHMPAKSVLPDDAQKDAPSIQMYPEDHKLTGSFGWTASAYDYRHKQEKLIYENNYVDAMEMDIKDIRGLFGDKYDSAIRQMLNYAPEYIVKHDL